MTHNTKEYHLLYNHQGSLRAVVDTEGTIIKELHYDSFGTITNDTNPTLHVTLGFAGGLYDEDTKLTRFGYRDYDAYTGKWTAKDPIGFAGGDANLYGYVLGDPVNGVDPEGLMDPRLHKALGVPSEHPMANNNLSGGLGVTTGIHYVVVGGNVHTQIVAKDDGFYSVSTFCGRLGPGVYIGFNGEAIVAKSNNVEQCTNPDLSSFSMGLGIDFAFGAEGFSGSISQSTSGTAASAGVLFGAGIGLSVGIDMCYTIEKKIEI